MNQKHFRMRKAAAFFVSVCLLLTGFGCRSESHKLEKIEGISPDCYHDGVVSHYRCVECGKTFRDSMGKYALDQVIIPKLDHDYVVVNTVPATCKHDGEKISRCLLCGNEVDETLTITDHLYRYYVTSAPTCNKEGERLRICMNCGEQKSEIMPAIGKHNFGFDNKCKVCSLECVPSDNLQYELIVENGLSIGYSVKGTGAPGQVVIPYYYNSLPILKIEDNAFTNGFAEGFVSYAPLREIGKKAFRECTEITSFEFPDTLKYIGEDAFSACNSLTEIKIPDSVESIGRRAFYACASVKKINLGSGVKSIGLDAFWNCEKLTEISVANDNPIYYAEGDCLIDLSNMSLVLGTSQSVIPTTVQVIQANAFLGRTELTKIIIPNSVKKIGDFAFRDCVNLSELIYDGTEDEWNAVEKGKEWNYHTQDAFRISFAIS